MKYPGYRIAVLIAFTWTVVLPFLWMFNMSAEFNLPRSFAFSAYRTELVATLPCAILLGGAWRLKSWAMPGLYLGALGLPLLKASLGGVRTDAWPVGAFLFICLALRLRFLLKRDQPAQRQIRK